MSPSYRSYPNMFGGYDSHEIQDDGADYSLAGLLLFILLCVNILVPLAAARYSREGMLFAFLATITFSAIIFDFARTQFGFRLINTVISIARRVFLAFIYLILGIGILSLLVAAFRWVFIG